jgi:DNA transformation protein
VGEAVDPEYIRELFAGFGPVTVRRMFSGAGVFADDVMFALVVRGVIYLKADEESAADFTREGLAPFSYQTATGVRALKSYWRMPERLYDDPDELAAWARGAMAAALRGKSRTGGKASKRRPPIR